MNSAFFCKAHTPVSGHILVWKMLLHRPIKENGKW